MKEAAKTVIKRSLEWLNGLLLNRTVFRWADVHRMQYNTSTVCRDALLIDAKSCFHLQSNKRINFKKKRKLYGKSSVMHSCFAKHPTVMHITY